MVYPAQLPPARAARLARRRHVDSSGWHYPWRTRSCRWSGVLAPRVARYLPQGPVVMPLAGLGALRSLAFSSLFHELIHHLHLRSTSRRLGSGFNVHRHIDAVGKRADDAVVWVGRVSINGPGSVGAVAVGMACSSCGQRRRRRRLHGRID